MDKNELEILDVELWRCPVCGYLLDAMEYNYFRFNLPCPRCGWIDLLEFEPMMDSEVDF
jgi:rubrerythrin